MLEKSISDGIVGIRSSTVVNRSAAVMSRSGSVDKSCSHHGSSAGFSFSPIPTHPDAPQFYHLSQIGMNRGESLPES